jgi:hypothetical protein
MSKQKVICVCFGGNNRSVCMAFHLKEFANCDAIAVGLGRNGREVQNLLFSWADAIIVMDKALLSKMPRGHAKKTLLCDVGEDRYGVYWHPDLIQQVKAFLSAHSP